MLRHSVVMRDCLFVHGEVTKKNSANPEEVVCHHKKMQGSQKRKIIVTMKHEGQTCQWIPLSPLLPW